MRLITLIFLLSISSQIGFGGNPPFERNNEILSVVNADDSKWQSFVYDPQLHEQRIDTLAKIRFWKLVMSTSDEWMIVNQASSRRILDMVAFKDWDKFEEEDKETYRRLIREEYCFDEEERIYITRGKSEFYQFRKAMPSIDRGIEVFMENDVDPWYAQAILLIESPGQLARSPVGALGSFQLMSKVARKFGLRVDSQVDERKDFDRSAYGASQLIKEICLPYTREMLAVRDIEYRESDLFFRLLVLHVYHAGAYNVRNALDQIDRDVLKMDLIQELWVTESKGFKNASQNYSQVALASLIQLEDLIYERCVIYHSSEIPVAYQKTFPEGSEFTALAEKSQ